LDLRQPALEPPTSRAVKAGINLLQGSLSPVPRFHQLCLVIGLVEGKLTQLEAGFNQTIDRAIQGGLAIPPAQDFSPLGQIVEQRGKILAGFWATLPSQVTKISRFSHFRSKYRSR